MAQGLCCTASDVGERPQKREPFCNRECGSRYLNWHPQLPELYTQPV